MNFELVLRSIGRVLWFAIAGAFCMALVGAVLGTVTGAILIVMGNLFDLLKHGRSMGLTYQLRSGVETGNIVATVIGFCSGLVAFAIAGFLACLSELPRRVFLNALGLAFRLTLLWTLAGAVLSTINEQIYWKLNSGSYERPFAGYMIGVIAGFVIGTFYGAIVGSRREIARQKNETVQQQNAALSITKAPHKSIEYSIEIRNNV